MKALKATFLPKLQATGYTLDGVRVSDKKSIGLVKVFLPDSTTYYDSENYSNLVKLKEGQTPNTHHYDDAATAEAHIFIDGVLVSGARSRLSLKITGSGKDLGVPHPMWPGDHTPFDTTLFIASTSAPKRGGQGQLVQEGAADGPNLNPFWRLVMHQLVVIYSQDSFHHLYKVCPRTHPLAEEEEKIIKIYTDFGMGEDDNYLFDQVRDCLMPEEPSEAMENWQWSRMWLAKDYCYVYFPSWSAEVITANVAEGVLREVKSLSELIQHAVDGGWQALLMPNVDYFLDPDRLVIYVFENGPRNRVTRPPLFMTANLPLEVYVRAVVLIRNRLLYYLCRMTEAERQLVANIVERHNADPLFMTPVAAGPDQRSRRSSTSSGRTSNSSSSSRRHRRRSAGTNAMEENGRRQSSSSTGSSSSSSSAGKRKRGE